MALGTYSGLKAAVANFSGRDDLTAIMDDFIDLVEEQIYFNSDAPLRVRQMEARTTLTGTGGSRFLALPADYLANRVLLIENGNTPLEVRYSAPAALTLYDSGAPQYFTITSQIEFDRELDSAYDFQFQYYLKPTALSSSNQTNDILTNYPSIYLFGCLSQVYDYGTEDQLAEQYYQKMIRAIKGANKGDKSARYGATPAARVQGSIA